MLHRREHNHLVEAHIIAKVVREGCEIGVFSSDNQEDTAHCLLLKGMIVRHDDDSAGTRVDAVFGIVKQVLLTDNQQVKRGQLLVVLDDSNYRIAVEQAQVNLKMIVAQNDILPIMAVFFILSLPLLLLLKKGKPLSEA